MLKKKKNNKQNNKQQNFCSKSPSPWCLTSLRMLPVLSFSVFPFALSCCLFLTEFCFRAVKDPASTSDAISGRCFDFGQAAASSGLPPLQTGMPVGPRIPHIWPSRILPPLASLCFTLPHPNVVKLFLSLLGCDPATCQGRGYTEPGPKYLQRALKGKESVKQSARVQHPPDRWESGKISVVNAA